MNNQHRIDELLRAADSARNLDADPHGSTGRRLLGEARSRATAISHTSGVVPRKRLVVAVAATLTLVSSVTAIATGMFAPDPGDVSTILDGAAEQAQVHLEGWRPELNAEAVWCVYPDGSSISTYASEFALDEPLTAERLAWECTSGNDLARDLPEPPSDVTVCGAVTPTDEVERRLRDRRERIASGQLSDDRHRFPVVLAWDADCATTQLQVRQPVDLVPLPSFDAINRARAVEISLRAAAIQHCLTDAQAHEMADQARTHLDHDWVVVSAHGGRPECYQVQLDAEWGVLLIIGR